MFKFLAITLACLGAAGAATCAPRIDTIAGRQVESVTLRHASSQEIVVFEGGSRGTIAKWGTVPERLAADASVFV